MIYGTIIIKHGSITNYIKGYRGIQTEDSESCPLYINVSLTNRDYKNERRHYR